MMFCFLLFVTANRKDVEGVAALSSRSSLTKQMFFFLSSELCRNVFMMHFDMP